MDAGDEILGFRTVNNQSAISKLVRKPDYGMRRKTLFDGETFRISIDSRFREMCEHAANNAGKAFLAGTFFGTFPSIAVESQWLSRMLGEVFDDRLISTRRLAPDKEKRTIVQLLTKCPQMSPLQICYALDKANIELPKRWQVNGNRIWVYAYNDNDHKRLKQCISSYISKIKRRLGLSKSKHYRSYR